MKYYLLEHSANQQEIGMTYPQSQTARQPVSTDDPRYLGRQGFGKLADIPLPEPVVHPDAKLTDLVSTVSTWRLIISPRLKNILEEFVSAEQCQFLAMAVHYVSEQHQYWMLNPMHFNMELIDYSLSEIWLCGAGDTKKQRISFETFDAFAEYSSTLQLPERVNIYKVVFIAGADADFIQLRDTPGIRYFVSEKLMTEIENAGCTGIQFTAIN